MQRRYFVQISISALGLALTPFAITSCDSKSQWTKQLSTPAMLGKFCSEKEINAIGSIYCNQSPDEKSIRKIEKKLLELSDGSEFQPDSAEAINQHLSKLIESDFMTDDTLMLDGWVISRTEARQCALYFLTHS